jgi:hypothetical protein
MIKGSQCLSIGSSQTQSPGVTAGAFLCCDYGRPQPSKGAKTRAACRQGTNLHFPADLWQRAQGGLVLSQMIPVTQRRADSQPRVSQNGRQRGGYDGNSRAHGHAVAADRIFHLASGRNCLGGRSRLGREPTHDAGPGIATRHKTRQPGSWNRMLRTGGLCARVRFRKAP